MDSVCRLRLSLGRKNHYQTPNIRQSVIWISLLQHHTDSTWRCSSTMYISCWLLPSLMPDSSAFPAIPSLPFYPALSWLFFALSSSSSSEELLFPLMSSCLCSSLSASSESFSLSGSSPSSSSSSSSFCVHDYDWTWRRGSRRIWTKILVAFPECFEH